MSEQQQVDAIFRKLAEPFPPKEVQWRVADYKKRVPNAKRVKVLAYIDARAVMDRLDEAVGPTNWNSTARWDQKGVIVSLQIRVPIVGDDGKIVTYRNVTHEDGSDESDIEAYKSAISGALKRAAVHFGIGRYLYHLGNTYADLDEYKQFPDPPLPPWALPGGSGKPTKDWKPAPPPPPPAAIAARQGITAAEAGALCGRLLDDILGAPDIETLRAIGAQIKAHVEAEDLSPKHREQLLDVYNAKSARFAIA